MDFPRKGNQNMKKLLFAVSALAALSLLAPSAGFAQTAYNQLGIYTDQAGIPDSANTVATVNVPFNAYLVLTNPWNHSFGPIGGEVEQAITAVDGFEVRLDFPESASWFMLSENFPANEINVGQGNDYVVGFATSVPVTDNAVVLVTWQFMVLAASEFNTYMNLTTFPSVAGTLAIVDADDTDQPSNLVSVYPSTNDFDTPVFSVNGTAAVATENESWGGVKALFK